MMNLNGNLYAAKQAEFDQTQPDQSGTPRGFFKRYKNRIEFFDMDHRLFAALVRFADSGDCGFVNAGQFDDGRKFYQHGASDRTLDALGAPRTYMAERDYANAIFLSGAPDPLVPAPPADHALGLTP